MGVVGREGRGAKSALQDQQLSCGKFWRGSPRGRAIGTITLVYREKRRIQSAGLTVVMGTGKKRVRRSVI